ncbi:hypothetical protein GCM10010245_67010 [Streptomyces spectabilis]|uniref:Uncharacterized protein n=1 Tax=Streptomyces spectabilis TaxID=68270 RepID=A0A7W8EZL1_STRST|nr:hypothetical protein [Streptomyces spectabilis]GGV42690.1 hypothetical protein GCM10010245_67010 [Streptomyces spectabilis]
MPGRVAGLIVAAVLPPSVDAALWRTLVVEHPLLAAVLLVAYQGVLALVVIAWRILSDLAKRWQQRVVDSLDRSLTLRFSRFPDRYRAALLGSLRYVEISGLETRGLCTPELEEVYIDVSLVHQTPNAAGRDLLAHLPGRGTGRHALEDFLDRRRPVLLAIVGAPGSGKTTLVRRTARQICLARSHAVPAARRPPHPLQGAGQLPRRWRGPPPAGRRQDRAGLPPRRRGPSTLAHRREEGGPDCRLPLGRSSLPTTRRPATHATDTSSAGRGPPPI